MAEFEELQQLWQQQPPRALPARDAASLRNAFHRYGRRHDLINIAKVFVLAFQLVFLVTQLRHRPLALFGACLADFSAVLFMLSDWRKQRAIARLNFADSSVDFVRNAIARLQEQRNPFRVREFYIAMGGFWVGCNFMFANLWSHMTLSRVLVALAFSTATPFAAYAFGRWVRGKRFHNECRPLIDRLETVLATIERERA